MGNCRDYPGALKFTLKLIKRVTRGKRNEFPISEPALVSAKTKIIGANLLFMNPWLEIFQAGLRVHPRLSLSLSLSPSLPFPARFEGSLRGRTRTQGVFYRAKTFSPLESLCLLPSSPSSFFSLSFPFFPISRRYVNSLYKTLSHRYLALCRFVAQRTRGIFPTHHEALCIVEFYKENSAPRVYSY